MGEAQILADPGTPRVYEERWAMTLLEQVLGSMREDYAKAGKTRLFEALRDFLWDLDDSTWISAPATRHGRAGAVSFAVGHAEMWP